MTNGISELLQKYGTSLKETRALMPKLTEAVKKQREIKPPALPTVPQFFTAEEAKQFGVELEPEWTLKVTPGKDGAEPSISYISPEQWEITQDQIYISPEGKRFTLKQLEAQLAAPEIPLEVEQVFGKVFPMDRDIPALITWAEQNPEQFLESIWDVGRTEDTETLLRMMFPEIKTEELETFFAPLAEMGMVEAAGAALGEAWGELTTGDFSWGELGQVALGALGVGGAWLEKYVGVPWEAAVLEGNARIKPITPGGPEQNEIDLEIMKRFTELRQQYGWTAIFTGEVAEAVHNTWEWAFGRVTPEQKWTKTFFEWTNPVYWVPVGTGFGLAAKFTSKVPLLGRGMRATAAGVQAVERGIAYPVAKPLALGVKYSAKSLEKAGAKLGEAYSKRLIKETEHLFLEIPESEALLKGVLVDNWMKRTLTIAAKIPPLRKGIEKGLGWRILVKRQSQTVEDIVGRAAVVYAEISRMGINAKVKVWELRAIEMNPVRLFGFNKKAYSPKMVERLLPEYKGLAEAGTLEHVFTRPEMYRLTEKQLQYVTRVHETNTEILNLLKKEGVAPENVTQDWWIHRVVTGKFNPESELIALRGRPGVRGKAIGAKPSFEMHRKAPTMAEGIAWGIQYGRNPELAITSYIEEAFKKVADARFLKYIEPFGILPTERLAARFPELVERAVLTQTELADAAHFGSLINRTLRGEKLPEQTLRAIERRFPDLGRRFRALAQEPVRAEAQLRELLAQNQKTIKTLQKRLEKVEAVDIEAIKAEARAEARLAIPDEHKLREAFQVMDFEDRLAFRSTMETQLDDIGHIAMEQGEELEGLLAFLQDDVIANYTVHVGKRRVHLDYFLKKGDFPESVTIKEAAALLEKRPENILTRVIERGVRTDRVPREVVLDHLTEVFKNRGYRFVKDDDLIEYLTQIADKRLQVDDLNILAGIGNDRVKGIKRMLGILDDVDTKPEFIPKAEAGFPEAGMQQDIFGYQTPVFPKGKGQVTQVSMEEYAKLVELRKATGLPGEPPGIIVKPKIEGVKGLEAETVVQKATYEVPTVKSVATRKTELEALRNEVKALTEARKAPYWQARTEKALKMEQVRRPEIGEGYIMQPFAGGRIFKQDFIDSFNKFFGHEGGLGVLKVTSDVAGILRITKAALDFSAMAIQGLPSWGLAHAYLLFNPPVGAKLMGAWYKAFFNSTRSFFDAGVVAGFIKKNEAATMQRISFGGSSRTVDYFAALEVKMGVGGRASWLMEKIPLKPYHRAETSFYAAGEMVRDEFWRILSPKAIARGQEFELARILDRITGIVDPKALGVPLTVRQLEQTFVWFAPSYTRACLTVLADVFRGGITGAEARKAIGGLIVAGSAMYSGVQYAMATVEGKSDEESWEAVKEGFCIYEDPITGEVEWKPSGKFMTLKIGNYYMGFGGFWYGLLRLAGNISATVQEIGEREKIDLVRILKHGSLNKQDNPFIYWWYSRSSPLFGTGFELATGREFFGYPIETPAEYASYIARRFEPIWAEQGLNWMIPGAARDNEIPEGLARQALIPAELFGLRTFPESTWVSFYDWADKQIPRIPREELDPKQIEAWEKGELEWKHLTEMQKANQLSRYPEGMELYEEAQADSAVRNSPHWEAWEGRIAEEREIYYKRISDLTDQLTRGEIDTREYREKAGEAGQNYGAILEAIERDPNYAEIYDFFDKKEVKGDKYGFRDDLALSEFQSLVLYAEDLVDRKGDYDWDERDRRVDAFIERWGQDTYDRIQQYLQEKKGLKDLSEVWIRKAADTEKLGRGYWRLPYKPIINMDEEDQVEGNIPTEYRSLWKKYQALETDAEREAFITKNPDLAKDWRAEYRKANPEEDARLALWGYGGKLQTREAYDLVTQWGRELGIPLEQMGLGLPPRSLIDQYFKHADIVRETSGGSIEAKLYKLEHPEWLAWGVENWGWGDLTDESVDTLRLRVKFKEQFEHYDLLPDTEQRKAYLETNPEFTDAFYQVEAYSQGYSEENWDKFVEYSKLPTWGDWRERFILDPANKAFYNEWLSEDVGQGHQRITVAKVSPVKRDEIYQQFTEQFTAWDDVAGLTEKEVEAKREGLLKVAGFAEARIRVQAYDDGVPEDFIENVVEYRGIPSEGYGNERYMKEHPDFYKEVWLGVWENKKINFDEIPSVEVERLYKTYQGLPSGTPRLDYRAKHPELDDWLVLKFGYKPISERGKKEEPKTPWEKQQEPKTPWEKQQEVERFKELF